MADRPKSFSFSAGQIGCIDSDGKITMLRSFSFDRPLDWTVVNGSSARSVTWLLSRFSRKVQHNIERREARARKKEQSNA